MVGWQMNDQLQRMSKEAFVASLFQVQYTSGYLVYKQFFRNKQKSYGKFTIFVR